MNNNKPRLPRFTLAAVAAALLALVLAVQGEARDPMSIVADARGHVAVARQHTARFEGGALELAARGDQRGEPAPTARFQLLEVRQGETVLTVEDAGDPEVRVSGRRISYVRAAGIVERYDVVEAGVEQSFVLRRRWRGDSDLVITGALEADRELGAPLPDGSGGLVIPLGDGTARLRYGAVTAIDAAGARRGGTVAIADGQVTLTIDGGWLAAAAYPVVVDPLIWIDRLSSYQGRPVASFDFGGSASIMPDATTARYLVAYESEQVLPRHIRAKLISWDGTLISTSPNISGDATVAHSRPAVAFKFGRIDSPKRNHLVAWQRSDGSLGYRILDRSGSPLMAPAKIAGSLFQDVSAATGPSGGWATSRCGTTFGCTPYLLAYRVWSRGATAGGSSIRLSVIDDGTGTLVSSSTVETYAPVNDPIYAPSIVYGHSSAADYFVLAYRRPNGEIVARKVDSMGAFGPAKVLASSSNGPPVVAYSHANNCWAVFWRANFTKFPVTSARIQGQTFPGNPIGEPIKPEDGARMVAVSVPLGDFDTASGLLPDYSAAGTRTATDSSPFQGLFELAYVRNGEVYSIQVYTGGKLGSTTRLTNNTKQDRYVKVTAARIDPPTTGLAGPLSCTGAPGSRCALWVYENFHSAADHDIAGDRTSSQY